MMVYLISLFTNKQVLEISPRKEIGGFSTLSFLNAATWQPVQDFILFVVLLGFFLYLLCFILFGFFLIEV